MWVVFLNSRSTPAGRESKLENSVISAINTLRTQGIAWPTNDYFPNYPDADPTKAASTPALDTVEGVRNAATLQRGVVPGSWFILSGVNLSQTTRSWSDSDIVGNNLPTSLDGVSVKIDGQPAAISYITPQQMNVQVPGNLSPGWVMVAVTTGGVTTSNILTWITKYAPGAFTYTQNGTTFAVATAADGSAVTPQFPAKPGDVISIYASGMEPSEAGVVVTSPRQISNVEVFYRRTGGHRTIRRPHSGGRIPGQRRRSRRSRGESTLLVLSDAVPSPAGSRSRSPRAERRVNIRRSWSLADAAMCVLWRKRRNAGLVWF